MDFESTGLGLGNRSAADMGAVEVQDNPTPGPSFMGGWLELWNVEDEQEQYDFVVTEPSELSWGPVDAAPQD